ncbi:hypothetical protein Ciccas_012182 [Cichlidogyrus casuarinus]|uniref:Uncharacterized protein n=1 Tax=Cichlidogyrus casuarinus TaxID=1844966 RepID=A0ABD2PP56_9PLAT
MWARAVKWFASYHCLTNKQSFEALALSLTCIPQSNDRRDVIEAIVREAETAERPFDALLDNVVATQRKLAEKDLLVILEGIKKSDEPPSVKYRRLAAVAADETQQLSLWKSMLGPLQQHLMSMYLDLKPDALIDEVLKRADDLVAIERATVGPSTSVASIDIAVLSTTENHCKERPRVPPFWLPPDSAIQQTKEIERIQTLNLLLLNTSSRLRGLETPLYNATIRSIETKVGRLS